MRLVYVFENFMRDDEHLLLLDLVGPVDANPGVSEALVVHDVQDCSCMENISCEILFRKHYIENILYEILFRKYYMGNILLEILLTWKVFYM